MLVKKITIKLYILLPVAVIIFVALVVVSYKYINLQRKVSTFSSRMSQSRTPAEALLRSFEFNKSLSGSSFTAVQTEAYHEGSDDEDPWDDPNIYGNDNWGDFCQGMSDGFWEDRKSVV